MLILTTMKKLGTGRKIMIRIKNEGFQEILTDATDKWDQLARIGKMYLFFGFP